MLDDVSLKKIQASRLTEYASPQEFGDADELLRALHELHEDGNHILSTFGTCQGVSADLNCSP
ncbi:MAG: hypothetical protein ABSB67_04425 [Bryobacteraceae bacterium]|jgi:hypothetical protein